jgi:uncharacterized protein YciI
MHRKAKLIVIFSSLLVLFSLTALSQESGNYYFVFLNDNAGAVQLTGEEVNALQTRHLANIDSLYKAGDLMAAGPFEESGGIFILKASSEDMAWEIAESDPEVKTGRLLVDLYPFTIQRGSFCKADDPFKLKNYTFIEFHRSGPVCKLEPETLEYLYEQHKAFLDTLSLAVHVVLDGTLEPFAGKIMIIDAQSDAELRAITSGSPFNSIEDYMMTVKTLQAGQDEFCEPK